MDDRNARCFIKQFIFAIIAAAAPVAIVACGGGDEDGTAVTPSESAPLPTTKDTSEDTDGTLLAMDAKTGQELWRARPPGGAVYQATAADGQVFVTASNNGNSVAGTLVAYDATTGEEQWRAPSVRVRFSSARRGVVVALGEKSVQGLDARTGKSKWSAELRERTDYTLIDGDNPVIIAEIGAYEVRLRALDRLTGQERWVAEMTLSGVFWNARASSTSALFLTQPFGAGAGAWPVTALDLETGEQRWVVNVGEQGTSYQVGLATNADTAFVSFGGYDDNIEKTEGSTPGSTAIAALDADTGQEIWRHQERGDPYDVKLAVADDSIYVESGATLAALDVRSGAVRWQISRGAGFQGQKTIVAGDGIVVLTVSEESSGQVLAFDAADGSLLWETEVPPSQQTVHSTVVSGNVVYVSIWGEVPAFGD